MSSTCQVTAAQTTIEFLKNQYVESEGVQRSLIADCCGIVGPVNVVGVGQALQQNQEFPCYLIATNMQCFTLPWLSRI